MNDVFSRVFEITGCLTQSQLAELLGIRQSSISDAKRRGCVPAEWLVTLLRLRGVNPDWILNGSEPRFLIFQQEVTGDGDPVVAQPQSLDKAIRTKMLRCFPARELADELVRRAWSDGSESDLFQAVIAGSKEK